MQRPRHSIRVVAASLLLLLCTGYGVGAAQPNDGYHQRSEIISALQAAAQDHPELVSLQTIGTSAGGHPLLVVRVAASGAIDPDQRPAVFVGANAAGYHNAGSEAALHLLARLCEQDDERAKLLAAATFYLAPMLNPDAHDGMFQAVRTRLSGNAERIDRDRDGLLAEDGPDDLDGDGRITSLRIPDPAGEWLPHPEEPRLMVKRDSVKGWVGAFRLESEGRDDDSDGVFNEDPAEGVAVDRSFPYAYPYPDPGAGPWPGYAPEAKAILDFMFTHRNIAVAVIYGPANNLLALPQELGESGGDAGEMKVKIPKFAADMLGFDPEQEYTLNEIWEVAKDSNFVRSHNITKEQMAQFFGAGPATKLEEDDLDVLKALAEPYKKLLEEAGLDSERPAAQYQGGGITPWLYYQVGALAIELDVWGIPKGKEQGKEESLDLERLESMSSEELVALAPEVITAFLKDIGAPPQITAEGLIERVSSGQVTPEQIAKMVRQMGGGKAAAKGGDKDEGKEIARQREVLAWLDEHQVDGTAPWTEVTLADGSVAEAGGLDPFCELAPPMTVLVPALQVHTATVLELARQLPRLEIVSLQLSDLGGGVRRVEAVAANRGELASHTKMAARTRTLLPVRLELEIGDGVELITGSRLVRSERLEGRTGVLRGEWLIRAEPGATVSVWARSETAGSDHATRVVGR